MTAKLVLDTHAMQEEFFSDCALIGIVSAVPGYRFCGLINSSFNLKLKRDIKSDIELKTHQKVTYHFALYRYDMPMNSNRYSVYQLKTDKQWLLPELKNFDYIFMLHGPNADEDAQQYMDALRAMGEVQMAQTIPLDRLKNIDNLIV
ncbi:MAG TPA: IPExxxVDY family protein [Flavipsychrobacter sp.]|nr:IPExxxVDY family protein [Flavipsychrobacter sp.]